MRVLAASFIGLAAADELEPLRLLAAHNATNATGAGGKRENGTIEADVCQTSEVAGAEMGNMTAAQFMTEYDKTLDKTQFSKDLAASFVASGVKWTKETETPASSIKVKSCA